MLNPLPNYLTLLFLCSISLNLWGQNNHDFLESDTAYISTPKYWKTFGNVSKTNKAYDGSWAIELKNNFETKIPGIIALGSLDFENFKGSQPYNESALTFSFQANYNLHKNDTAQIILIFFTNDKIVAQASVDIFGSTNGTFFKYNLPVQWPAFVLPDSLAVFASSLHFEKDEEINGNGFLIIDDLQLKSLQTKQPDIYNHSFENWIETPIEFPQNWFTTDLYIKEIYNAQLNNPSVKIHKSNENRNGVLEISNRYIQEDLVVGFAIFGNNLNDLQKPTIPLNFTPKYLQVGLKYEEHKNDFLMINAVLWLNGAPIAFIDQKLKKLENNWIDTQFIFNLPPNIVPDSASIAIAASDFEEVRSPNTKLFLDYLKLSEFSLSTKNEDKLLQNIQIVPNPSSGLFCIKNLPDNSILNIYDYSGKQIWSGNQASLNNIKLKTGTYLLKITTNHFSISKKLIIQ